MSSNTLHHLNQFHGDAGDTWRGLRNTDAGFNGFGEVYFSWINPGATKAWKRHREATCNLVVPVGRVIFSVETKIESGIFEHVTLSPTDYFRLTIEPGRWFGFKGVFDSPSLVVNISSHIHDDEECENMDLSAFEFGATL